MTSNLTDWTDVQLQLEHDRLNRWLDLPYSYKWAEEYKANLAQIALIWAEMQRRKKLLEKPERRAA